MQTVSNINKNQLLEKQFKKYQQINRILDSHPQTLQAKDQKIRSLTILLKRQFDQNKLLNEQLTNLRQVNQTLNLEISARSTQSKNYQKEICKEIDENAKKKVQERKQKLQIQKLREQLKQSKEIITKMQNQHKNTLVSMQSQISFLKMKALKNYQNTINTELNYNSSNKQNQKVITKLTKQSKQLSKKKLNNYASVPKTQRTVSLSQNNKNFNSYERSKDKNFINKNAILINKKNNKNEEQKQKLNKLNQVLLNQEQFSFENNQTARKNFMKNVQNLPNFNTNLQQIQLEGCKFYQ